MKHFWEIVRSRRFLTNFLVVLGGIAFYLIMLHLQDLRAWLGRFTVMLSPLLLGVAIAFLLNPLAVWLEKKIFGRMKNRRAAEVLGILLAYAVSLAVFAFLVAAILPQLFTSAATLAQNLSGYFASLEQWLAGLNRKYGGGEVDLAQIEALLGSWNDVFRSAFTWVVSNMNNIMSTSMEIGSSILNFFISVIVSIYVLLDKKTLKRALRRLEMAMMPPARVERMNAVAKKSCDMFFSCVSGYLLDAAIVGLLNFTIMTVFGMPYAILCSVIVAVTNIIPVFGPVVGGGIGAAIMLLTEPMNMVWFLLITIVLQTLDGYVIKVFLFGGTTGLRPLWVLLAVILGGRLFGVLGMFLGIPVAGIVTWLCSEALDRRLAARGMDEEAAQKSPGEEPACPAQQNAPENPA